MSQNINKHVHHYHRHMSVSYARSVHQKVYGYLVVPFLAVLAVAWVFTRYGNATLPQLPTLTWGFLVGAVFVTFTRLLIADAFALALAIPLALLINYSPKVEKILLPLFDVVQSVPVLAFFPVVILFFVHYNQLNGAGIFILLLTMMWSIVFSVGTSSGAVDYAVREYAKKLGKNDFAVMIFGDSGRAYLSKNYYE